MDRRDLMKYGLGAACVAVVPEMLTLPTYSLTPIPWKESNVSLAHRETVEFLVKKLNRGKTIDALTSSEWGDLATSHHIFSTLHSEAGNLHNVDLAIKANAAYLKTRVKPEAVDYIVQHGSYNVLSRLSGHMILIRDKAAAQPLVPSSGIMPDYTYNPHLGCSLFFVFAVGLWGLFGLLIPEIAIFCFLVGFGTDIMGAIQCS